MSFAMKFLTGNSLKAFFLSLFAATSIYSSDTCRIKEPIVSLSGPISFILKELGLIKDPNLKAVSSFHHFIKGFKGQRISGGIYLSLKRLREIDGSKYILFSDESFEVEERLKFYQKRIDNLKKVIFVRSRSKDPFTVTKENLKTIKPYLASSCEYRVRNLEKDMLQIQKDIANLKFPDEKTFIFYLGNWAGGSYQTILAKDSFNLTFLENKNYKTYPSDLAYLNPSSKILKTLKKNAVFFGLVESNEKDLTVEKIKKNTYNLHREGILYPGLSQVYFMKDFAKWLGSHRF